ncbi:MAG: hypothetical protein MMC33_006755 [Icmadophila ericetorum]|nr:hypothetical protein [Icmadophila ericetorum]
MVSHGEDITTEPPTSIDPYTVLKLPKTATLDDIKSTYKKLALRHHPDKVPDSERSAAHTKFQEIAFAYAILSDPGRRSRYDSTGSTSESLDDFNWTDFFRTQYSDLVTSEKINDLKAEYQGSEEEAADIIKAYVAAKGKMTGIYTRIMLSNMLVDEERFRKIIDGAIEKGEVEKFDAYTGETEKSKTARMKRAKDEQKKAEEAAKKLGIYEKIFGGEKNGEEADAKATKKGKKAKEGNDESKLLELMEQRAKGRAANAASFLDNLEAKYVKGVKGAKKRGVDEEPSEEAFEKMAKRAKKSEPKKAQVEEDADEDAVDDIDRDKEISEDEEAPKEKKKITSKAPTKEKKPAASRKTASKEKRPPAPKKPHVDGTRKSTRTAGKVS